MRSFATALALAAMLGVAAPALGTDSKKPPAALSLHVQDLRHDVDEEGRNRYRHSRIFQETAGIGVTITRGKVCRHNGEWCLSAETNYRVEPGLALAQTTHHVATELPRDRITLEYWAVDDNGHEHKLEKTLIVEGEEFRVE